MTGGGGMPTDERRPAPVTWEAADKGASCAMGCIASTCFALAVGMGLWWLSGGLWKAVVAVVAMLGGLGIMAFLRRPSRGKWEVTFDPGERVIRLLTRVNRRDEVREIGFDDVARIALEEIQRETSDGKLATFQRLVIHLEGGDVVALDERLSVRDKTRAQETLAQMREMIE